MKKHVLFSVLFLCVMGLASEGQEMETVYPVDKSYKACVEADGSTLGMLDCISRATKQWDQQLNKYYKLLLGELSPSQQASLREAQRQWILFRDKETKLYMDIYSQREGTMWNVVIARRGMAIVRQRAIELMEYYDTITQR